MTSKVQARKMVLGESEGTIMPVYVRLNNPMDTRKEGGTSFSGRDHARLHQHHPGTD